MRIHQLLIGILFILTCFSLHLHHEANFDYTVTDYPRFMEDYRFSLADINSYFGNMEPKTYFLWLQRN
jgi:hypothetical protein